MAPVSQASNGICYAVMGDFTSAVADIERLVGAVPRMVAAEPAIVGKKLRNKMASPRKAPMRECRLPR